MLEIKKLKAGYGEMEVLKGIDFHIDQGEIISIIGPNGAGKSTLLKSIFNLTDIYSGDILFDGENLANLPTHQLIKKGISFIPQGRQIFPSLSVKENIEMGAFAFKEIDMERIFKQFPFLKEKQNDYAFTLSGGQQQILTLGRALVQNPNLLLLDEPSLGLAPKVLGEIFNHIVSINKNGVSVVVVEQNIRQSISISDRTYVLEDGEVALEGDKEILKNNEVKGIFLGRE